MIINNMDIAGLVRRVRRIKFEINKCASAALMSVSDADLKRIHSYIAQLNAYFAWMMEQPIQDLPEWHPQEIEMGEAEVLNMPENEGLVDLIQQFDALEHEMANAQSARMATSMMAHDEQRFIDLVDKIDQYVTVYLTSVQPLDMPESTPKRAMTGPGRKNGKK